MSSRQSVLLTSGVLILVIIGMVMNFYTTSRANDTITEVQRLILEGRQIGNLRGNVTLGAVGEAIGKINNVEDYILTNLTQHRVIANETRDIIVNYIQSFNATNEEGRTSAVDQIIEAVNNNTRQALKEYLDKEFDTSGGIASIH